MVFILIQLDLPINRFLINLNNFHLSLLINRLKNLFLVKIEAFGLHLSLELRVVLEDSLMEELLSEGIAFDILYDGHVDELTLLLIYDVMVTNKTRT